MESTLRKTAPKNLEIIETLCFKPDEGFIRLPGHIDRLEATCSKLRYSFDRGAVLMALGQAVGNEPLRVRLTININGKIDVKEVEASAIKRLRKEPDEIEQQEETEEETNDDFENLYKGQVSKSGVAILPSKRTRRIPEVKKPSLADEALSQLKAEQPDPKEENLDTEEAPIELSEEAPAEEENKSE